MTIDSMLDKLTNTFSMDRRYCADLLNTEAFHEIAKIIVYYKWATNFIPHIQAGLVEISRKHFDYKFQEDASLYTSILSGSILKDMCLIPYLAIRGVEPESAMAIRRSLEHLGVLTHFWYNPEKIAFIKDRETREYKKSFVHENDKVRKKEFKSNGIAKRFESFRTFGQPATHLYSMFSNYFAHGGTPNNLMFTAIQPSEYSCGFVNRSLSEGVKISKLLSIGSEILCAEIAFIHGTYGKKYNVTPDTVGEGGRLLAELLSGPNGESNEMKRQIDTLSFELGCDNKNDSRNID